MTRFKTAATMLLSIFFAAVSFTATAEPQTHEIAPASVSGNAGEIVLAALDLSNATAPVVDANYSSFKDSAIIGRVLDPEGGIPLGEGEYSPMKLAHEAKGKCHRAYCLPGCPRCGSLVRSARDPSLYIGHCKKGGKMYACMVRR